MSDEEDGSVERRIDVTIYVVDQGEETIPVDDSTLSDRPDGALFGNDIFFVFRVAIAFDSGRVFPAHFVGLKLSRLFGRKHA